MKYVKKPIPVDAIQWTGHNFDEANTFIEATGNHAAIIDMQDNLIIPTLEGDMKVCPGSFIIRGIEGEVWGCKERIFLETYELVED